MSSRVALITGASQGIGLALAKEAALRGYDLVMVALPDPTFDETANELGQRFGCKVHVIPCDLCQDEAPAMVFRRCQELNVNISLLINNVGLGFLGYFEEADSAGIEKVLKLNIIAVTRFCKLFIPMLREQTPSHILNVASLAAYSPMPFKSVYAASKSYVYSFSRALREELKPAGISVSILNPGPVLTNANTRKASESLGTLARLGIVPPEKLAHYALNRTLRGKAIIIPGKYNRFLVFLQKLIPPSVVAKTVAKVFKRTQHGSATQRTHY
jgi:uncharacterized protein